MRNQIVRIRVTAEELATWRDAATAAGHASMSAWLRGLAMLSAATGVDAAALRATLSALRADLARGVGNNLNQIAFALHQGRFVAGADIERAIADIRDMRGNLTALITAISPGRSL